MSLLFQFWVGLSSPESRAAGASELFSDTSTSLFSCAISEEHIKQADIIHLHWTSGVLFSPQLFRQLKGKKVVWTFHDMEPFTGGCHYHISCRRYEQQCGQCPMLTASGLNDLSAQGHQIKRELYRHLDLVLASPSAWLAGVAGSSSLFAGMTPSVIPNAHDTAMFCPQDRQALRAEFDIDPNTFVVLAGVESLENPRKNMGCVIEAMDIFAEEHPEVPVELVLFGGGKLNPTVCYTIRYTGSIERQDLVKWYNIADVFVHPSRLDNLSNTLCEAQCCGTPVIAFDAGGSKEAFHDGVTGFISGQTPQELAKVLYAAASSDLGPMRSESRRFALDQFGYETIAGQYTRLYEEHCRKKSTLRDDGSMEQMLMANAMESMLKVVLSISDRHKSAPPQEEDCAAADTPDETTSVNQDINTAQLPDAPLPEKKPERSWFDILLRTVLPNTRRVEHD